MFKFNCSLGNRYLWRFMLVYTKRPVHNGKFLHHALSHYVYNRGLLVIFGHTSCGKLLTTMENIIVFWKLSKEFHSHKNGREACSNGKCLVIKRCLVTKAFSRLDTLFDRVWPWLINLKDDEHLVDYCNTLCLFGRWSLSTTSTCLVTKHFLIIFDRQARFSRLNRA